MIKKSIKEYFFFILLFTFPCSVSGQVTVHEVSIDDPHSYIELLVTGIPTCDSNCVDIRGWIIDDNNGWFSGGQNFGINPGCMRFTNVSAWDCVKMGTLIVIYNNAAKHPSIPPDDYFDADSNCVLILPDTSYLLESNLNFPNFLNTAYSGLTFSPGGNWQTIALDSAGDALQLISPNTLQMHHAVSWGNNAANPLIYFSGSINSIIILMNNTINDDPFDTGNWKKAIAADNSPGFPNSLSDHTWIHQMNNDCKQINIDLEVTPDTAECIGTYIDLFASGGEKYLWNTGDTTDTITIRVIHDSLYSVTAVNSFGCKDSAIIQVHSIVGNFLGLEAGAPPTCIGDSNGRIHAQTKPGFIYKLYSYNADNFYSADDIIAINSDGKFNNLPSGSYIIIYEGPNRCSIDTLGSTFSVFDSLIVNFPTDTLAVDSGSSIFLHPFYKSRLPFSTTWYPSTGLSCTHCRNPWVQVSEDITYIVQVKSQYCTYSDTIHIRAIKPPPPPPPVPLPDVLPWGIPNAFTPNDDRINDVFRVEGDYIARIEMKIFNRWGEKIFEGEGQKISWDGRHKNRLAPPGIYVYYIKLQLMNEEIVQKAGSVTLLR